MNDPLEQMVGQTVVLDTGTPIIYIGTLALITDRVFVLQNTDMHDCREGHAGKELYLAGIRADGIAINRRGVVVMRSAVISVSLLEDIVAD